MSAKRNLNGQERAERIKNLKSAYSEIKSEMMGWPEWKKKYLTGQGRNRVEKNVEVKEPLE